MVGAVAERTRRKEKLDENLAKTYLQTSRAVL